MSLTSYRAAPPRATFCVSQSLRKLQASQNKGPLERPHIPLWRANRKEKISQRALGRPGSDLLSRVLRRSTISAGAFHGRVRNGIGCSRSAITTRSAKRTLFEKLEAFACFRANFGLRNPLRAKPASVTARRQSSGALAEQRTKGCSCVSDGHK